MIANLEQVIDPKNPGQFGYVEANENPYDVYIYPNFLDKDSYEKLLKETKQIPLKKKYSDMFNFFQSNDIKLNPDKNGPSLNQFIEIMTTKVKAHLSERTQIELDEESPFDITVSRYDHYNYLLCHNDHSPDPTKDYRRAMAFIYYLTSAKFEDRDGGALSLYACDKLKQPREVQQKIYPTPNTLVVFPTSDISWHSVDEVLSFSLERLSINGWFNSSKLPKIQMNDNDYIEPCPYSFYRPTLLTTKDILLIEKLINPMYLKDSFIKQAALKFKTDQMLKLNNILNHEIYDAIVLDLHTIQQNKNNQLLVGPANKRNYGVIDLTKLTPISNLVHKFFRSSIFLHILSQYTGLDYIGSEYTANLDDNLREDADMALEKLLQIKPSPSDPQDQPITDKEDKIGQYAPRMQDVEENQPIKIVNDDDNDDPTNPDNAKKAKLEPKNMLRMEYRNYQQGSYTIMHDEAYELFEKRVVDLILPFNSKLYNKDDYGGYHSYLDRDKDAPNGEVNETVRILADPNSLNLIARNNNMRFFRYITHHIPFKNKSSFQELNGVYYEKIDLIPGYL